MSDAEIAEGLRYGREPRVRRSVPQLYAVQRSTYAVSPRLRFHHEEQKQKLIGTADYVPFYRIIDEEQYTEGLFGQVRRGNEYARNSTSAFDNPDARD